MKIKNPPYGYWERDPVTGILTGGFVLHADSIRDTDTGAISHNDSSYGRITLSGESLERLRSIIESGPPHTVKHGRFSETL